MAIPHAGPGEVIDVKPLGAKIADTKTSTLLKTDLLEVLRMVLPAGKKIAEHRAPSEITVQCLEGHVKFTSGGRSHDLTAGSLLYLSDTEPHALEAMQDSSVLVTLLLKKKA